MGLGRLYPGLIDTLNLLCLELNGSLTGHSVLILQ